MLVLYDTSHSKLCGLDGYTDLYVKQVINSGDSITLDTLHFKYALEDNRRALIQYECYVATQDDEYIVKEINLQTTDSGITWVEYICDLNVEPLKGTLIDNFTPGSVTADVSANLALAGTGWEVGYCDVAKKRTAAKTQCTSFDAICDIQKAYACEITFDSKNKLVNIHVKQGADRGAYFAEQLNLKSLQIQGNSRSYVTRLYPVGKDGMTIASANDGVKYVSNYQYSTKIISAYWIDNRYTVAADMMEDAQERLDYLSKPTRAYGASIIDLARVSDKWSLLDFALGDYITLVSESTGTREQQRIIETDRYLDEPEKSTCEIANRIASLDDIVLRVSDTADAVDNVTDSTGAVQGSSVQVTNSDGTYTTLNAAVANVGTLVATKADITDLTAVTARITTLESSSITTDYLTANYLTADSIQSTYATIDSLNVTDEHVNTITGQIAAFTVEQAGQLYVDKIADGTITSGSAVIASGAIGDAQIADLSAGKLTAGIINTSLIQLKSSDGRLLLDDTTMQISDGTNTRVQIGKDASGDYNLYLWDKNGNLLWDAAGIAAGAIPAGIIRNDMISDDAAINAGKIDDTSLVTRINNASTYLNTSRLYYDSQAQTLEAYLSTLSDTVTSQGTAVTQQGTDISVIQGKIDSKIWQTDINTSLTAAMTGSGTQMLRHTSNITSFGASSSWRDGTWRAASGGSGTRTIISVSDSPNANINSGVQIAIQNAETVQTDIAQDNVPVALGTTYTISCYAKCISGDPILRLQSWKSETDQHLKEINVTNTSWELYSFTFTHDFTDYPNATNIYFGLKGSSAGEIEICGMKLEQGTVATGWSPAPEDVTTSISSVSSEITQLQSSIDLKVDSSTYTSDISTIESRLSAAELKVTDDAIVSTVKSSDILTSALNGSGTNLFSNSTVTSTNNWAGSNNATVSYITASPSGSFPQLASSCIKNTAAQASANIYQGLTLETNTTYTASFYVYIPSSASGTEYSIKAWYDNNGWVRIASGGNITSLRDNWVRGQLTFTVDSTHTSIIIGVGTSSAASGDVFYMTLPKLEQGSVATGWSPAPEDVATTSNAISIINQTAESITISADKINIDGLVQKLRVQDLQAQKIYNSSKDYYGMIGTISSDGKTGFVLRNTSKDLFRIASGPYGDDSADATIIDFKGSLTMQSQLLSNNGASLLLYDEFSVTTTYNCGLSLQQNSFCVSVLNASNVLKYYWLGSFPGNHQTTWNNANTGTIPVVNFDGVMEIGKYIDFHGSANSTSDYDIRMFADGSNNLVIWSHSLQSKLNDTTWQWVEASQFVTHSTADTKQDIVPLKYDVKDIIQSGDTYAYRLKGEVQEGLDCINYGFVIGDKYNVPNEVLNVSKDGICLYSMTTILWQGEKDLFDKVSVIEAQCTAHDSLISDLYNRIAELESRIAELEAA